jgi:signal transduction histidine kinase
MGGVMNRAIDFQNSEDLAFFGKVNASISHELKNILAIISEAAGLLHDLTEMAAQGKKVAPEMLLTCSQDIDEEIQRGFATIKQMNIFSHSVDDLLKSVNLIDVIDLMIKLAGFLSFAAKVRFEPPPEAVPMVFTCPFRLQNLIYQTLVFAFESVGADGEIQVAIHSEKNGGARIAFSTPGSKSARPFPSDNTKRIAESMGAEICVAADFRTIDILVPQSIDNMG